MALAVAVLGVAFLGTLRAAPVPSRAPAIPASARSSSHAEVATPTITGVPVGWWTYLSGSQQLVLPADAGDVVLTSIPDRYLNDPPAVFRVPVSVRGTTGIAAIGPPASLIWTEGDLSYSISSPTLTVPQLVDLASALR